MTADRVEQFRADLAAAPAAIRRLQDAWLGDGGLGDRVPGLERRPIRFTGLGSSRFAGLVVAADLAGSGTHARVEWASAGAAGPPEEVLFAISSSGRTPEVVEAARRHAAAGGTTVAVTTGGSSPLAQASSVTLPLLTDPEGSGIACTTFRATVAVLALATGRGSTLEGLADRLAEVLGASPSLDAATLDRAEAIDVIGDGRVIGALEQAALMLREGPRLRAHAWDAGDWLHTAVYTALPGHRAILFAGTPYDEEISDTIRRRGGEVVTVPTLHVADPVTAAIVGLAAVEIAAAAVWARTAAVER